MVQAFSDLLVPGLVSIRVSVSFYHKGDEVRKGVWAQIKDLVTSQPAKLNPTSAEL